MKKSTRLSPLYDCGAFSSLDIRFADFLWKIADKKSEEILLSAALVSRSQRNGHICMDLTSAAGTSLKEGKNSIPVVCPALEDWLAVLGSSGVAGKPGDFKPLVLDHKNRLYLHRYWEYEQHLAELILKRVADPPESVSLPENIMDLLFPSPETGETDWQKVAAFAAMTRKFCVISGGPGTGKTTTVARILALLTAQAGEKKLRIALTAPTGKAAARLQEAIVREKARFGKIIQEDMESGASTIHRLLGYISGSPDFRHNAENPLSADVVVVDEASMVDMALMSKLVQALPEPARLILLGDKDQLTSVEAGYVLGDICDTGNVHPFSQNFCRDLKKFAGQELECKAKGDEPEICDCIVQLQKSHRFGDATGIQALSQAINEGSSTKAAALLKSGEYPDISWKELPRSRDLGGALKETIIKGYGDYLKNPYNPTAVFRAFDSFRILCALRKGPFGVEEINRLTEQILSAAGIIHASGAWYKGRPVLISRNDYHLDLFNGDVGIALPDPDNGDNIRIFFRGDGNIFRKFNPMRLPEHETVFAMTVHKSQGSEFGRVVLILPDQDSPVLTRELLYTGITRAVSRAEIWGTEEVFSSAVSRNIRRTSGLRDALWE
ncbi:MAG: exodeoxyribonuclease V subunit alpha [Desulfococcaceae bacterium]